MSALRVHMLEVVERLPNSRYRCRCDCGTERVVKVGHFHAGNAKSCGCTLFRADVGAHGPCAIEGCGKPRCNSRGWCWQHYTRWRRHGDPMHSEVGHPQAWLLAHVDFDGESCLTWPFGGRDNGYGTLVFDGEHLSAHRQMCVLVNGPAPSPAHEAAHSCGKGHEGCVHPKHLSWKTPVENQADKIAHGTDNRGERHPFAMLTEEAVRSIRQRYRPRQVTYAALAAEYGVTPAAVACAVRRDTWGWLE